jgi:DNA polymerase III epsilon subunit-like protein
MLRLGKPLPSILAGQRLVVVDAEANGRQPPEIVEIAVFPLTGVTPPDALFPTVHLSDLRMWLVRPARPIAPVVTRRVHGIRNEDVLACPPWREVAADVAAAVRGRVLVAHNAPAVRAVLAAHLPGWEPPLLLDTSRLARALWPGLPGYSLERLATHARITPPDAQPGQRPHRAGYDTLMTVELLLALLDDATGCGLGWDDVAEAGQSACPSDSRRTSRRPSASEGTW